MDEVSARIDSSGFSPVDKMSLRRGLLSENSGTIADLSMRQLQKDNPYGAKRIESWIKED